MPHLCVAIPFREDLLSDNLCANWHDCCTYRVLPSLSERTFFRTERRTVYSLQLQFAVAIPFREDLLSDRRTVYSLQFAGTVSCHPFQRGPSFGHAFGPKVGELYEDLLPSLSERTFFRTLTRLAAILPTTKDNVAIPFREDLLSDKKFTVKDATTNAEVAIPFREDLLSDNKCRIVPSRFPENSCHPFQRGPSFGQRIARKYPQIVEEWLPSLSERTFFRTVIF